MSEKIQNLINGNKQFREKFFGKDITLFSTLVTQGQRPKILIIACADSRIDPAMIFNCQPGELFVIRNVANLVPPCEKNDTAYHGTSAALEFGVCVLEVEHIIILGHSQCGGIQALLNRTTSMATTPHKRAYHFVDRWMNIARPAYDRVMENNHSATFEEQATLCEHAALLHSLQNLESFPWIQEWVAHHKLSLHAWYFDLATGMVHRYDHHGKKWLVQ